YHRSSIKDKNLLDYGLDTTSSTSSAWTSQEYQNAYQWLYSDSSELSELNDI
ncbi:10846_t:CDS:1, partial [Diversispora eburnea]